MFRGLTANMSEDQISSSLGALAQMLADRRGSELECLKGISQMAPDHVSSFIQAALSSDGEKMHRHLTALEEYASRTNSFQAWFDLGILAHRFLFNKAAEEYYERSISFAELEGENASKALNNLGCVYMEEEDWERASICLQRAMQCLDGDISSSPDTPANLGKVYRSKGEYNLALECYEMLLPALSGPENQLALAETWNEMGNIWRLSGDLHKSRDCYQKSLRGMELCLDQKGMAKSLANLGQIHQLQGEWAHALDCFEQARHHLNEAGDLAGEAEMYGLLGDVHIKEGRLSLAIGCFQKSLDALRQTGDLHEAASILNVIGQVLLEQGELDNAIDHFRASFLSQRGAGSGFGARPEGTSGRRVAGRP
jgi:tetratricopeptide (TPR) repeat protein